MPCLQRSPGDTGQVRRAGIYGVAALGMAYVKRFGRQKSQFAGDVVRQHLQRHLGPPFASIDQPIGDREAIEVPGFADAPQPGMVTVVTNGLASFARKHQFAGDEGYALELLAVIGSDFLNDEFLDFFGRVAIVYADGHSLLEWHEPIRLSSDIPGSSGMRYLLPSPTAVFEESLATVQENDGTTFFCLLLPLYEDEAMRAVEMGIEAFHDAMERLSPEYWNLRRRPLALY